MSNPQIEAVWERRARKADDDRHEHGNPQLPGNGWSEVARLNQLLDTLDRELDQEADAEILADGIHPNTAMRFLTLLRRLRQ